MLSSLITKHISNPPPRKKSVQVIGLHDVTVTVHVDKKRRCAKSENLPTHKGYFVYTLTIWY